MAVLVRQGLILDRWNIFLELFARGNHVKPITLRRIIHAILSVRRRRIIVFNYFTLRLFRTV